MREDIKERIDLIKCGKVPEGYKKTKLGIIPKDWEIVQVQDVLEKVNNPVEVKLDEEYTQIGIRSHGKGIFCKEPVTGKDLGNKRVFWVEPNCFVVNIVFAWERAVARTTDEHVGLIASHRFPMYRVKSDKLNLDYAVKYFLSERGKQIMEFASPGGAGRNRTMGLDRFMASKMILPPIKVQEDIVRCIDCLDKYIQLYETKIVQVKNRKKWIFQNASSLFGGQWKKTLLSEVLKERKQIKGDENLRICSVSIGKGIVDQIHHLGKSVAAENTKKYRVVKENDIVYTKSPTGEFPYGIVKQHNNFKEEVAVSPLYGVFETQSFEIGYIINEFFSYRQKANNYLHPIVQKGAKNTINITNSGFLTGEIELPQNEEVQKRLVEVIKTANKEIELRYKYLDLIKQEKEVIVTLLLKGIA